MPVAVYYPLLNANEPEALLAAVLVTEGGHVTAGDLLFTVETTKSAADVAAESSGFVAGLRASQGQTVRAGEIFCYLAEQADWKPEPGAAPGPEVSTHPEPSAAGKSGLPDGLRITRPALALAQSIGFDLSRLPVGPLVTEKMVQDISRKPGISSVKAVPHIQVSGVADMLIYGGGGHGKALIDLLRSLDVYHLVGVVDDGMPAGEMVMGLPVLGGGDVLAELYEKGVHLAINAVGGIGNVAVRVKVFEALSQAGFTCPAVVHPAAWVEPSARLADGIQVFPFAYVGSEASLGFGTIVNTGAIVSHECVLGEYVNISPGAILAGQVQVGDRVLIGMGVTVNLQVKIGGRTRVGNSATVKSDVPPDYVVRAGTVYP